MKALWLYADVDGKSRIKPLPLPIHKIFEPLDAEMFRRQARGEVIGPAPRLLPSSGLRSLRILGERNDTWRTAECRQLMFVLSGSMEVTVSNGCTVLLEAADILLEDDMSGQGHCMKWNGDCRVLLLRVSDDWMPKGEIVSATPHGPSRLAQKPLFRRMYRASDDKAYFRPFEQLFDAPIGVCSALRPAVGFQFVHMPHGSFVDWHPEVFNNFVVVMTGELELEVSGDREIQIFGPGDVCLAEDRTGDGHIDRTHGDVRLACIHFEDRHLWTTAA